MVLDTPQWYSPESDTSRSKTTRLEGRPDESLMGGGGGGKTVQHPRNGKDNNGRIPYQLSCMGNQSVFEI